MVPVSMTVRDPLPGFPVHVPVFLYFLKSNISKTTKEQVIINIER